MLPLEIISDYNSKEFYFFDYLQHNTIHVQFRTEVILVWCIEEHDFKFLWFVFIWFVLAYCSSSESCACSWESWDGLSQVLSFSTESTFLSLMDSAMVRPSTYFRWICFIGFLVFALFVVLSPKLLSSYAKQYHLLVSRTETCPGLFPRGHSLAFYCYMI